MKSPRLITVVGALVASLAVGACGDGDSDSSGSTEDNAAQASGDPIKVMIIAQLTSPLPAGIAPEAAAAAKARTAAINAAGGIDGRPLELLVCDTQTDPNKAGECARKAVSEGAVALVGTVGVEMAQVYPILEKAGIASIGALPLGPAIGNSPVATCFTTAVPGELVAIPELLEGQGAQVQSAIYPGDLGPGTELLESAFARGLEQAGVELGALATFPSKATQFDAAVAKALGNGTQGVMAFAPGPTQGPLVAAILRQNPDAKIAMPGSSLLPSVVEYLGDKADGLYAAGFGMPATSSAPGIELFNADLDEYAGDEARNDLAIDAWASVWAFEKIAQDLPAIDRASVLEATKRLSGLDLGGIYEPLDKTEPFKGFPGMECVASPAVVLEVVEDGKVVPLEDGKFTNPFE